MGRKLDTGATSAEYALLIALVAAAIVASVGIFGLFVGDLSRDSCDKMLADGVAAAVPSTDCR